MTLTPAQTQVQIEPSPGHSQMAINKAIANRAQSEIAADKSINQLEQIAASRRAANAWH